MNQSIRRFCLSTPFLRGVYVNTRRAYHKRRTHKAAEEYFVNVEDYRKALTADDGATVDIRTKDGLTLTVRRNRMDAAILSEIFLDHCYVEGLSLPERPTVVDIGGYNGDFAVYAAKCLNARKVVVCEPSPRNWTLLERNVANNHYEDRIAAVNKAVTNGDDVMLDVEAPDGAQARVSAYCSQDAVTRTAIPGVTLAGLVEEHRVDAIDLLKIDCEGGEYAILAGTPSEVFKRIRNIVFEYHEIEGFQTKLNAVKQRLCNEGFSLKTRGNLISAVRA